MYTWNQKSHDSGHFCTSYGFLVDDWMNSLAFAFFSLLFTYKRYKRWWFFFFQKNDSTGLWTRALLASKKIYWRINPHDHGTHKTSHYFSDKVNFIQKSYPYWQGKIIHREKLREKSYPEELSINLFIQIQPFFWY